MYGQMTAGSWIHIGTQGILQGTYEARLRRRVEHRCLDEVADDIDDAVARCLAAKQGRRALSVGLVGNAATVFPELLRRGVEIDVVTDQTSAHDPLSSLPEGIEPDDWSDHGNSIREEARQGAAGVRSRSSASSRRTSARICWLGYGERDRADLRSNEMVARGEVSAPVVSGRDHLDAGSVASPYRETGAMADGSDTIADWPLLDALVSTSSGASRVSIHHGGGVGMGRSIHAGQVWVADGTELAARKLARVLTNDPGTGVVRHVDAGYGRADDVAAERGVRVPMGEG